jgi:PAS domain S-box-containing protein
MMDQSSIDIDPRTGIFADRDGRIRVWGSDWAAAFGYDASYAVGQSLDLIIPQPLQPVHWRGFTSAMRGGKLKRPGATLRVPAVHKDGSVFPAVFVGGTLVFGQDGTVEGIKLSFVKRDPDWVGVIYRSVLVLLAAGQSTVSRLRGSATTRSAA